MPDTCLWHLTAIRDAFCYIECRRCGRFHSFWRRDHLKRRPDSSVGEFWEWCRDEAVLLHRCDENDVLQLELERYTNKLNKRERAISTDICRAISTEPDPRD